jgi:hypothetical protein
VPSVRQDDAGRQLGQLRAGELPVDEAFVGEQVRPGQHPQHLEHGVAVHRRGDRHGHRPEPRDRAGEQEDVEVVGLVQTDVVAGPDAHRMEPVGERRGELCEVGDRDPGPGLGECGHRSVEQDRRGPVPARRTLRHHADVQSPASSFSSHCYLRLPFGCRDGRASRTKLI